MYSETSKLTLCRSKGIKNFRELMPQHVLFFREKQFAIKFHATQYPWPNWLLAILNKLITISLPGKSCIRSRTSKSPLAHFQLCWVEWPGTVGEWADNVAVRMTLNSFLCFLLHSHPNRKYSFFGSMNLEHGWKLLRNSSALGAHDFIWKAKQEDVR